MDLFANLYNNSDNKYTLVEEQAHAASLLAEKEQRATDRGIERNNELLAQPDKVDNFVASNMSDIYPFAKKPSMKGQELKTAGIEESLKDHPLAGSVESIKQKFTAALADPRFAKVGHGQLLQSIKQDHLNTKDAEGISLLDKVNAYKYKKDNGFWSHAEDKNVVASPTYEAYKAKEQLAHPNDTSALEAIVMNAAGAAALTVGGIAVSALTGGAAAAPILAEVGFGIRAAMIASRAAKAAALAVPMAVPEFKAFDAVANAVSTNDKGDDNTVSQMAAGMGGLLVAGLAMRKGTGMVLAKAMESGKFADGAASLARVTGTADAALKSYDAGKLATSTATLAEQEAARIKVAARNKYVDDFVSTTNDQVSTLREGFSPEFARQYNSKLHVSPEDAHVMGLSKEAFDAAHQSPATMYMHLSDEGASKVDDLIAKGTARPEELIINQFNQEAAIKRLEATTLNPAIDFHGEASKAYKIQTYAERLMGEGTNKSASSKSVGGKIRSVAIDFGAGAGAETVEVKAPTYTEALLGVGSEGAPITKGMEGNIKIEPVDLGVKTPEPPKVTAPLSQAELMTGKPAEVGTVSATSGKLATPEVPIVPVSKLTSTNNGGLGKLGAAGVATAVTGGLLAGTANDSEAGLINAESFKIIEEAGKKIWNMPMQKVTNDVAEAMARKISPEIADSVRIKAAHFENKATDMTLSELRNTVVQHLPGNGGTTIDWKTEKAALEKMGISTDEHIMSTGVNNDNFEFGYKHSNDDNLFGPGTLYSTSGVIRNGVEDITGGYSGINPLLRGHTDDLSETVKNKYWSFEDKQGLQEAALKIAGTLTPEENKALAHIKNAVHSASGIGPLELMGKNTKSVVKKLEAEGVSFQQAGPNVRQNVITPTKVFDMSEMYAPTEFGLPGNKDMQGYDVWNQLGIVKNNANQMLGEEAIGKFGEETVLPKLLAINKGELSEFQAGELTDLIEQFTDHTANYTDVKVAASFLSGGPEGKAILDGFHTIASKYDVHMNRLANDFLQEKGYDAITHIGGSTENHRVWIPLNDEIVKPFYTQQDRMAVEAGLTHTFAGNAKTAAAVMSVVGTVGMTALMNGHPVGDALAADTQADAKQKGILKSITDFISPNEAGAAMLGTMGAKIPKLLGKQMAGAEEKTVMGFIKEFFDNGWVSLPVKPGQVTLSEPMKVINTAPVIGRGVTAFNSQVKNTTTFLDGLVNMVNTPYFFDKVYGTTNFKFTSQLAMMQGAIAGNTDMGIHVMKNILTPALGAEKAGSEIAAYWKPVQDAYNEVALPLRTVEVSIEKAKSKIIKLGETLGAGDDEAVHALIKEQQGYVTELNKQYAEYLPKYQPALDAYEAAKDYSLNKWSSSRISYAVEEPGLITNPKYASLYTAEEKAAVQQIKDVLGQYKVQAQNSGMETIAGDFNHHSMDKTKLNEKFSEALAAMGMPVDAGKISFSSFMERSKYSKQMIPDITRNMLEYIPDATRRIHVADFWKKGDPNGWDAFSKNEFISGNKVWNQYFDRMKQVYNPQEKTLMNDLSNKYASIETLRLLFGAPSAAFKHLFKNEGTWATMGFFNSMKHIPEAVTVASRNAVNESFYNLGLNDKIMARGEKDLFVRSMVKQRSMLNQLDGVERDPGVVSKVDEWLGKLNNVGGVGIQAVEAFDRSHTVLNALGMAARKGMTAEQAMTSMYDTILRNNFLGGGLNPKWMQNPSVRALMLFQGTPFKIMERRLIGAITAGSDLKTAWGTIKASDTQGKLKELQGLGMHMLDAQREFKQNMLYDALTGTKDVYGNSVSTQFAREAVITGAVIAGGAAVGMDFMKHSLHVPFLKDSGAAPELAVNPLAAAAWKTAHAPVAADDKTFFPARFLKNYVKPTGGMPTLMMHKFQRLSNNDIPEIYQGSSFKYLFSVPSSK